MTGAAVATVVQTDAGPVTLLDLPHLRAAQAEAEEAVRAAGVEAGRAAAEAEEAWARAGALLVSSPGSGGQAEALTGETRAALALIDRIRADDDRIKALGGRAHSGLGGLLSIARDHAESHGLQGERDSLRGRLRPLLISIARSAPPEVSADCRLALAAAAEREAAAGEATARARAVEGRVRALGDEVARRQAAVQEMGFDPLYAAAYLAANGPEPVPAPVILKKGEQALVAEAATLCRWSSRSSFVGASQGISFPIGHTGIRYRIGAFRGHPVEQRFLAHVDAGTLVLTTQRLVFVGRIRSTSTPVTKLLHVEVYADALAVFVEGRETPNLYLTGSPKYLVFMLNWVLAHQ